MKALTTKWVKENSNKRFTIKFENGRELKNVRLFVNGGSDSIGYLQGRAKRMGKFFPMYDNIKSITEVVKKEITAIGNAKTILGRIHPNAWLDLQKEMQAIIDGSEPQSDFNYHFAGKLNFRSVTAMLGKGYSQRLKEAFENKTEFSWSRGGRGNNGRDLRLSTQIGEDGKFRAYFSSEYIGCGNGDYWLLINPTTAIYYERD